MKKKSLLILPILGAFLLAGCELQIGSLHIGGKKNNEPEQQQEQEQKQNDQQSGGDQSGNTDPGEIYQHATKLDKDPKAPFYLKVGETRQISVTLSPSPTLAKEKTISWSLTGNFLTYQVDSERTNKVSITGVSPGVAYLKATNDYNDTLTQTFTIKVIDFDEENAYLWQYESSDRYEFGYQNAEGLKNGTAEGDAKLGDLTWHYTRSRVTSLQSTKGAIGFGKGKEPEEHIHLETTTDRLVDKFTIEAASANSLAKMTIKVGDTVYMNELTVPDDEYDVVKTIYSDTVLPNYGKIEIDVITPSYDPDLELTNPSYRAPGAFLLKSILIDFKEEVIERIEIDRDSEHQVDYYENEEITLAGLKLSKISNRGVKIPVDIDLEEQNENLVVLPLLSGEASHTAKKVELSLRVDGYDDPFTTTYNIHVRGNDWVPSALQVEGSVSSQFLIEGDEVDYSNLRVKAIYDLSSGDVSIFKFEESNYLSFAYGSEGDPFVAEKVMDSGYTIVVTGNFTSKDETQHSAPSTTLVVNSGILNITEAVYDRIDYRRTAAYEAIPGLNTTGKAITYTTGKNDRVQISYEKVAAGNRVSDGKALPKSNGNIFINILDTNLSIDKLNIEFAAVNKNKNEYTLYSSIYGGDIYGEALMKAENYKIIYSEFEEHTNALYFEPSTTNYVGIVSILIRYKEVSHIQYDVSCEGTPTKMDYLEGEKFDPTGLSVLLTPNGSEQSVNITDYVKWYDGSSYSTAPQETLLPASTYVVGVFRDKTFNVNIGSVTAESVSVVRVTNVDQLVEGGKYYITCPSAHLVLKGSTANGDIRTANGSVQDDTITGGDNMNINIILKDDYMDITPVEDGKFTISSRNGGYLGITKGGSATCSSSVPNRNFEITINGNGTFTIKLTCMTYNSDDTEKGEVTMYYGSNGSTLFNLYTTDKANIVIYKVS